MKAGVYDLSGRRVEEIDLPPVFSAQVRPDLIWRAYLAIMSRKFQPKGKSPTAGKKYVVESPGTGYDISRVSRTGGGFGVARFIALAVGGRRVRAPKSNKVIIEKINKKEKLRALESAIAATADPILIQMRGHKLGDVREVPIIIVDEFELLKKTAEVRKVLHNLGLKEDLERAEEGRRIRAGKGKRRGRRYKRRKGPLIVVSGEHEEIIKAARNLEGVDVVPVNYLSIPHLAPGGHPGRLTIWTKKAIELIQKRVDEKWARLRAVKEERALIKATA